jgi:hypothetical protein
MLVSKLAAESAVSLFDSFWTLEKGGSATNNLPIFMRSCLRRFRQLLLVMRWQA